MRGKILPILFLFGIITSSVTNHVMFQIERLNAFQLFKAAKYSEHSGSVQTIIYTGQTGFHWEKLNKEFFFSGKLYDVVSTRDTKSGVEIKCIADQKEDNLVANYLKSLDTTKNKNVWTLFLKQKTNYSIPVGISKLLHEILYNYHEIVLIPCTPLSPDLEKFSPPPKHYSSLLVG